MAEIVRISPQEALDAMKTGSVYVDVRTPEEFGEGHPEGAYNVPVALSMGGTMAPNEDFIAVMKAHFPTDAKLVLGCKAGGRSLRAAHALTAAGYTNIVDQRAGWDGARDTFGQIVEPGWSRANLPAVTGHPSGRSWADLQKKK
jgi:rhodanese-related sulfurtransferase